MNNRTPLIQKIIRERKVRSQEELSELLAAEGVRTTQATLSRDFKRLNITKQRDPMGGSYYILPDTGRTAQTVLFSDSRAGESIVSIDISGQLCVIKTLPGCANMAGALVDEHSHPAVMGTIAGDDTLLLMLRKGSATADILQFLKEFIPNPEGILIQKTD
ncbi:MAG: hypothetical protein IJL93_07030 [Bacteroidales bacterium]|nr:hypothetical protein [Bacteroidales bacterium]